MGVKQLAAKDFLILYPQTPIVRGREKGDCSGGSFESGGNNECVHIARDYGGVRA